MKNSLLALVSSLFFLSGFSQEELQFNVNGRYSQSVKQESLTGAKYISDFVPGYPVNWITSYASVQITSTCNGKVLQAMSANDALSPEQINILNTVDLGANIIVDSRYKYKDGVMSDNGEDGRIYFSIRVVPEVEAEYVGGNQQMKNYLKENVIPKITAAAHKQFQAGSVTFTVSEEGRIVNAKIFKSSGNTKTDQLLVEEISKMPKWTPAQNSKGVKVRQEFEFTVGSGGC